MHKSGYFQSPYANRMDIEQFNKVRRVAFAKIFPCLGKSLPGNFEAVDLSLKQAQKHRRFAFILVKP
jgi:hypothetical protein